MFTGIIDRMGQVAGVERKERDLRVALRTGYPDLAMGESVAVNGVCLTVVGFDPDTTLAEFDLSAETLRVSSLVHLKEGSLLNLERALLAGSRLSGHWVQGHVDGLARLVSVNLEGESRRIELELPEEGSKYVVDKGSIALDGVSLTVNQVVEGPSGPPRIRLQIIPHTWVNTALHRNVIGDVLNVEWDILAKYVERQCQAQLSRIR
ncbi:MAG: riboflavin synthase [Bdellovibrionales bacterium]|nr:riboflavin synthase [Bdellovibrionales bacterium]